jgi:radical SAM protein with 4Fe4S-binding SPASM domain
MTCWTLHDKVFLIEGFNSHAIYDFNCLKLYSINNLTLLFIRRCISSFIFEDAFTQEDKTCFDFLRSNSIIKSTDNIKDESKLDNHFTNIFSINFAWIEVTNQCNLRCKHCYASDDSIEKKSIDLHSFTKIIDELLSIGVKRIQIIGGEPLILNKKLKEMMSLAADAFQHVSIYTNSTLIDRDWASFFFDKNIKVNTTVFSYSSVEHDKATNVSGSHKKTNEAIYYLKERGTKYSVSCVRMNGVNIEKKETELYDLKNKCDIVRLCGRANFDLLNHELLQNKIITKKRFSKPLEPKLSSFLVSGHNCFSQKIYISYDLRIFPCVMERGIEYGSLKEEKLSSIINKIIPITKNSIKVCKDCEFRYACMDCRPDRIEKDVYAKPWYCSYDPYKSTWQPVNDLITSLKQINSN